MYSFKLVFEGSEESLVRFGDSKMQLGDIGTEFKYETKHIRVWDLILSPGQCSDWHRHESLYVFIVTRPGTLKTEYEDGSTSTNQFELGEVVQGQKGALHRVTNVGDEIYSNSIVEIKEDAV